jgi:hypothetical protein
MVRPTDSAGVLEQGRGTGWVARKPERSRLCPRGAAGEEHRPNKAPGPMIDLASIGSA